MKERKIDMAQYTYIYIYIYAHTHTHTHTGWRRVVDLLRTDRWKIYGVTGSKEMSEVEEGAAL